MLASDFGNRWGRFKMSGLVLVEANKSLLEPGGMGEALAQFMSQVIIFRANDGVRGDVIEYWGVSPLFDEIVEGDNIPTYGVVFVREMFCSDCGEKEGECALANYRHDFRPEPRSRFDSVKRIGA